MKWWIKKKWCFEQQTILISLENEISNLFAILCLFFFRIIGKILPPMSWRTGWSWRTCPPASRSWAWWAGRRRARVRYYKWQIDGVFHPNNWLTITFNLISSSSRAQFIIQFYCWGLSWEVLSLLFVFCQAQSQPSTLTKVQKLQRWELVENILCTWCS